jgi:D-aminopeptidase
MSAPYQHVLIVADIEGSSGCFSYRASRFMAPEWPAACEAMSRDVSAAASALLGAGVERVTIHDFHRTGYNLLPELIDPGAQVVHGYRPGPVPGLGDPGGAEAVVFVGLHAPSGAQAFLAHTLTSRMARLEVNGRLISEVELFSGILAPYGVRPIFFSGCPVACAQAGEAIPGLACYPIDKSAGPSGFDAGSWRQGLAEAVQRALKQPAPLPYRPEGPLLAEVTMRAGAEAAERIARRWHLDRDGPRLIVEARDMDDLYRQLSRAAYLNRLTDRFLPQAMAAHNLLGRVGLAWVRHQLRKGEAHVLPGTL